MSEPFALIVEDDPDLSEIFSEALKMGGFHVEVVQDGGLALEKLLAHPPDLVILDLHLPTLAGTSILSRIRSEDSLQATKVIVTTADARMAETLQGKANLILIKPISFSQLRDLAKRLYPKPSTP